MLAEAGVPVTVMVPIVPAINDSEIEAILEECAKAGASVPAMWCCGCRLRSKTSSASGSTAFPGSLDAGDVAGAPDAQWPRLRSQWGKRQKGEGPYAKLIADRFAAACRRFGFDKPRLALDHTQFHRPMEHGGQQDLFSSE